VEALIAEFLPAMGANKMLWMPSLVHGNYAFIFDGPVAISASRREQVVIVVFAIRSSRTFEEVSMTQLLSAMRAGEMLWVPHLAQGDYHLANNGFIARGAIALGDGGNSMLAQIAL
jgi:hypothetical protein